METNTSNQDTGSIASRTICLSLAIGTLGTRQKVATSEIDTGEADKTFVHVSKEIFKSNELRDIRKHDTATRQWLAARSLPSVFRGGIHLVPITSVETIDATLATRRNEREALIDIFIAAYPKLVAGAPAVLANLFDPSDYPSVPKVRAAFTYETRYMTLDTPTSLKSISKALFDREADKAKAQWADFTAEAIAAYRAQFADLVAHMVDKLTPGEDGKKKIFRGSALENVREFVTLFETLNVADDKELAAVTRKVTGLLEGIDPELIRKEEGVRDALANGFVSIKATLDTLVAAKPKRKIEFEADEPADVPPAAPSFSVGDAVDVLAAIPADEVAALIASAEANIGTSIEFAD